MEIEPELHREILLSCSLGDSSLQVQMYLLRIRRPIYRQVRQVRLASQSSLPNLPPGFQNSPFFQKILAAPNVLSAVQSLITIFKQKNITMDKAPSFTEMMTLARDAEIQTAMKELKAAMDKDGISVDMTELLKHMPKK